MTKLTHLLKNISQRVKPFCVKEVKRKLTYNIIGIAFNVIAIYPSISYAFNMKNFFMMIIGCIFASAAVIFTISYIESFFHYKKIKNMEKIHRDNANLVALHGEQVAALNDEEVDALLAIPLSEKVIAILNDAISTKGHIVYADVFNMYEQETAEATALLNHLNFISNKDYADPVQQQNLETMASINTPKQTYKSFNSRKVL